MNVYQIFQQTQCQRVSDGERVCLLPQNLSTARQLLLIWSQLGDFDSLEYAWWLQRDWEELVAQGLMIRAVGIGDRTSGEQFCHYTGFPQDALLVTPDAQLHQKLGLYAGLSLKIPGLSPMLNVWLNLLLMCGGLGSPGTLAEVFRGYRGDRQAPQLIADEEVIHAFPLPPIRGSFFQHAGGKGFQRPFELATLRLRNMAEVLGHWQTYVPDPSYLTQQGGTFLLDSQGQVLYEHRDRGILGFAENMSSPLSFLSNFL